MHGATGAYEIECLKSRGVMVYSMRISGRGFTARSIVVFNICTNLDLHLEEA